jgi:hypothetical protein
MPVAPTLARDGLARQARRRRDARCIRCRKRTHLDGDAHGVVEPATSILDAAREARQAVLRAYSDRGGELIPALIRAAEAQGRSVRNINLATPSLETLFISLTGRKLD